MTERFRLVLGTGGAFTGAAIMSLPVTHVTLAGFMALGTVVMDDSSAGFAGRRTGVVVQASTITQFFAGDNTGSQAVGASIPFTWAAGDTLAGTLTYETA